MSLVSSEQPDPASGYLAALKGYSTSRLQGILRTIGAPENAPRGGTLSGQILALLAERPLIENLTGALPADSALVLRLFHLLDAPRLPVLGVGYAASLLGFDPDRAVEPLLVQGLVALASDATQALPEFDFVFQSGLASAGWELRAHPEAMANARPSLPAGEPPPALDEVAKVFGVREADGLEPILRLAALWQKASEGPFRQTQTGALYKRDRDRLTDDSVLAGPIADMIEPLPDMPWLWLGLARATGLVQERDETIEAADAEFWAEHAVHLPQMIAEGWLGLDLWHEQVGAREHGTTHRLTVPFLRLAALMWLARLPEDAWAGLSDLERFFRDRDPSWDRLTLDLPVPSPGGNSRGGRERAEKPASSLLESILLGPAYQLDLVSAAEDRPGGRKLVRITPLGRYVLGMGRPPQPRETFDQFLYVQPNFEVIAYRQGLNSWLIGLFSQFLEWTQLGAALELRLTPEWVYRGLEGGLSTDQMLQRMERHGGRALPSSVIEALKSWSARRERVNVHTAATLIEFASTEELIEALKIWPGGEEAVTQLTDRIVLANDSTSIPFDRFRVSGSRDYRQPPEPCLEVEPDGVTVSLELGRSDLFIGAELARLFDEQGRSGPSTTRSRYRLSKSLALPGPARGSDPGSDRALVREPHRRPHAPLGPALAQSGAG